MDITKLVAVNEDEATVVHFRDLVGELEYDGDTKEPIATSVVGTYSKAFKDAQRAAQQRFGKIYRRGAVPTPEQIEEADYATEAACITGWCFQSSGKTLPITALNWRLIGEQKPHWREQLKAAMSDHERFSKAS